MKKIILLFLFFIAAQTFAQTNGISYQAIIMNPKGEQLPGVNNANSPVVNKDICMVFKFIDEFSNVEYQETVQTKTDGFGMVNLVIGKGTQTAGYAASFQSIVWNSSKKSLIVGINTSGNCATYTEISNQEFSYAPLAFSAINAENVTGVVAIENGGTNATTVLGAKTNLGIENVDNTTDLNKPISNATQTALNLKENVANKSTDVNLDGTSDTKYPSVKAVKTYIDATTLLPLNAIANEVTRATTAENTIAANLVTETSNRTAADNTLTTNLTAEITARTTADATLTSNLATEVTNRTAADLLKEDVANKSTNVTTDAASDTKYPSVKSVKTYVDASAVSSSTALANEITRATNAENTIAANLTAETTARTAADVTLTTNLTNEVNRATNAENTIATNLTAETTARTNADATLTSNLATEVTNRTAADLLKEDVANKSTNVTTDGASDTKYPSVKSVKTYVDASAASSSTALANEITRATNAENTIAANLTAETTARTAADVTLTTNLTNEVNRATNAENAIATNLTAETTARTNTDATLTSNLATEVTNRTAADLLKEDVANKSTNVTTDGASDTKYPSVKSVKTYVDASAASSSTALADEITRATNAENTIAANLTAETTARTTADATLTSNLATEVTNRTAADLLKEDVANKSTDVTTDGSSDTKYPSVKSVKTYVDASATSASTALANEVTRATNAENTIATNLVTESTARMAADLLKEDVANKSIDVATDGTSDTKYPSVKAVKDYVDAHSSAGGVAGADTQITFNNAGVAAGSANLTWNDATSTHTVTGTSVTTNETITALAGTGTRVVGADATGNLISLANGITGSGSNTYLTKWTGTNTQGNSQIQDNGTSLSINYPPQALNKLFVYQQQQTATGDGQHTLMGYRDRNTQNTGTAYSQTGTNSGSAGLSFWGDPYSFATAGFNYNDFNRCGGAFGGEIYGAYWGALGYKNSANAFFGVYGSNAYSNGTGFLDNTEASGFGGGFFGVIGSASKGSVIGQLNSGELFSSYNSGNVYTLGKNVELVATSNDAKTPVYSVTSTESTIYAKGSAELVNGSAYIPFKDSYKALLGENPEVTVTPKGNCNGVYISSIDKNGFTIKEMNNGTSTVAVSWISVGNRVDNHLDKATQMVSDPNFDRNIQQVLYNDSNLDGKGLGIWWDGNKIQFGDIPESITKVKRPKEDYITSEKAKEEYIATKKEAIKRISEFSKAILFDTGKSTITSESYAVLNNIVEVLNQYSADNFIIEGNTDNTGESNDNMKLSRDRSEAVMNYFIQKGISKDRLKSVGYGDKKPVATNDSEEGRKSNRRVEINLVK